MTIIPSKLILTLLFSLALFFSVKSQSDADSQLVRQQELAATTMYYQSLKTQSGVYNGSEYVAYAHTIKEGFPYFDTTTLTKGSLLYNQMLYNDVPMLYDIVRDELIIQHFNKVFLIQLIKSKLSWFNIQGHLFVHLTADNTSASSVPKEGFYDLVYNGKTQLYVRRTKQIQESIADMKVERKIYSRDKYYIYKSGIYTEVNSEGSVLKVLGAHQNELKKAVKTAQLRFRKNREAAIKTMVQKFDELSR